MGVGRMRITAMIGNAVRIGVIGALALVGSMQIVSSVPQCIASDQRVVSLAAQWKIATGDAEGAYKLIRRADARRQATTPVAPTQAHVRNASISDRS